MNKEYDIIVVGAGLIGSAAARYLVFLSETVTCVYMREEVATFVV